MTKSEMMYERDAKITALKAENFELRARITELEAATLELVGGEWKKWSDEHYSKNIGMFEVEVFTSPYEHDKWEFVINLYHEEPFAEGSAPNCNAAMKAGEHAFIEEIKKFVSIQQKGGQNDEN